MRKMSEVLEALAQRWDAPLKQVDGFDYIPWEATVSHMNEVFGPLGWSHDVVTLSLDEKEVPVNVGNRQDPRYELRTFMGYSSSVPVEVQVFDDVHGTGQIIKVRHTGVGFGPIIGQGNKNPLDNAAKTAKSDGISTAAKHFGDAFGLFLYRKEAPASGGASGSTNGGAASGGQRAASGGGAKGYPVSDGRKTHLAKNGYSAEQIEAMTNAQASTFFDRLWKDHMSVEDSAAAAGIPLPASGPAEKSSDSLPIPAGRR